MVYRTITCDSTKHLLNSKHSTDKVDKFRKSGVYQLTCPDYKKKHAGQTGRSLQKDIKITYSS